MCEEKAARIAPTDSALRLWRHLSRIDDRPALGCKAFFVRLRTATLIWSCRIARPPGRNEPDIARIYQLLTHAGVRLVTIEEDDIDEMKIGCAGVNNKTSTPDHKDVVEGDPSRCEARPIIESQTLRNKRLIRVRPMNPFLDPTRVKFFARSSVRRCFPAIG
jgi:hypothetical protein